MYEYQPHPIQVYTLSLPLLVLGTAAFAYGWETFGTVTFCLGVGVGIGVILSWIWREHAQHADRIADDMEQMDRVRNPDVWDAMGYRMPLPDQPVLIQQPAPTANSPPQLQFPRPPVTAPKMQLFSDGILMGKSIAETEWGGPDKVMSLPEIRKLKAWLEHPDRRYIQLKNAEHPRLGYRITAKGKPFFLYYASQGIKGMFEARLYNREGRKELPEGLTPPLLE